MINRPTALETVTHAKKALIAASLLLFALTGSAAAQTIMPTPFQTALDNSGNIINNACVWVYVAGTTTAIDTYTNVDVAVGHENLNPIRSDSAGRFTAYLKTGTSYKFVYESACTPPAHGSVLRTADNIPAVPPSTVNLDVTGTAGEALTAGQVVYLSDGSGSKTAGSWYKADSANTYSSTTAKIGLVPNAIGSGSSGSIRIQGQQTGLTSLLVGTTYFVGTAGALTSTGPANRRVVGVADTTSSLVLVPAPTSVDLASGTPSSSVFLRGDYSWSPPLSNSLANGSLSLTTGTPCPAGDVTGASTVYYTPTGGNLLSLYDGVATWTPFAFSELSVVLSGLVNAQGYDVFAFNNSGTPALETAEWANATITMTSAAPGVVTWTAHGMATGSSITFTTTGALPTNVVANTAYFINSTGANTFNLATTRANLAAGTYIDTTAGAQSGVHTGHQPQARQTAITRQNGVWVKSGTTTRRWVGSFLTTSTSTTEDSATKRFVSNADNRCRRQVLVKHSGTTYAYSTATYRQANADAANQSAVFIGTQDPLLSLDLNVTARNESNDSVPIRVAFGEDSTNTAMSNQILTFCTSAFIATQGDNCVTSAHFAKAPTAGLHVYVSLERPNATGVTTWWGNNGDSTQQQTGQSGWVEK